MAISTAGIPTAFLVVFGRVLSGGVSCGFLSSPQVRVRRVGGNGCGLSANGIVCLLAGRPEGAAWVSGL